MKGKTFQTVRMRFFVSLLIGCLGLFATSDLYAQQEEQMDVSGVVFDVDGLSVIGASVVVKGTAGGTITDVDGKFKLKAPKNGTLVVSFIGYTAREVAVAGKSEIKIILQEDAKLLEDVVVIGYGSVKKEDLTGSVSTIDNKSLAKGMATSASDLLVGKAPGVTVISDGGAPGAKASIRIRGGSSVSASNDPLIVIDGVPVDNGDINGMSNPLSTVNPNDIESFSVLKDASATAIYGSRASNGVIIITTKKGQLGRAKVSYSGSVSVNTKTKTVDVMNADTFREYVIEKHGSNSDLAHTLGNASTNWQDEIFRTSISTDHNIGLSGAIAKKIPYRASVGYTNDNGILKTSNLERWTGSIGFTPKFFNDHLSVSINVKGVYNKNRFADVGAIGAASQYDPTQAVYADGIYGNGYNISLGSGGTPNGLAIANPLAVLEQKDDRATVKRSIGNLQLDYKMHFLPELRANLNLGYDVSSSSGYTNIADNSSMSWSWGEEKTGWGENKAYTQLKRNHLMEFYLSYAKDLGKHHFDVLGGYSWQHFYLYETNAYPYSDAAAAHYNKKERKAGDIFPTENYLISFFSRANYVFDSKYMATFTLRNDGSSRFHEDVRWGLYPSAALAWRINQEAFLKDNSVLSDLKLRVGYGITGQQNITGNDNYPYLARYKYSEAGANYFWGNNKIPLLRPEPYNLILKWEETTTANIGFDYGFLRNRLSGSLDYYYRTTDHLLNKSALSAGTNFSNELLMNVGELKNQGVELNIIARAIESKDLNWTLNYNVAYNKNKIVKLSMFENGEGNMHGGIDGGTGTKVLIHATGNPFGSFYVYEQIYDSNGSPIEGAYVDKNGNGEIDPGDRGIYKSASPDVVMGFSSQLSYKKWDFNFAMHANIGNYAYNNMQSNNEAYGSSMIYDPSGFLKNRLNSARSSNFEQAQYLSSHYIQNASFLRMDNISVGYTFDDKSLLQLPGVLRVYATLQNPFVITKYKGVDPEFNNEGIDKNIYPRPRSYMLGLSYNF